MENFTTQSSENILNKIDRTGENVSGTSLEDSIKRLEQPLEQISYSESGSEDISANEFNYHFSYSPVAEEDILGLEIYTHQRSRDLGELSDPSYEIKNWRKLDDLSFFFGDKEVDVFNVLPEKTKIFFCPELSQDNNGAAYKHSKNIYIVGSLATPFTLTILLNEIGHIIDFGKMEELGLEKMVDDHPDSDQAELLRKERTASAFALKVIRPYIKDEGMRHDVINLLKYYALKTYYHSVNDTVGSRKSVRSHVKDEWADYEHLQEQEDMDRMYYDAWEKWKLTDKYKEWKNTEENKKLDEYEEYGQWRMWIEKINYDFWDDLAAENTDGLDM